MPESIIFNSEAKAKAFSKAGGKSSLKKSKIDQMVDTANIVLYETSSRFPFELSPTKLIICPNRITISNMGHFSNDEYPMAIESITNARIHFDFFFAGLSIDTFGIDKPPVIKYLKRSDARIARRYILALIECKKNGVSLLGLTKNQIKQKLQEIGRVRK